MTTIDTKLRNRPKSQALIDAEIAYDEMLAQQEFEKFMSRLGGKGTGKQILKMARQLYQHGNSKIDADDSLEGE